MLILLQNKSKYGKATELVHNNVVGLVTCARLLCNIKVEKGIREFPDGFSHCTIV